MTISHPKPILLIAYYYPPLGGVGVQRVLKFTRYLPQFGWQPHVLTVRRGTRGEPVDPSLLAEVPPKVRITRTGSFDLTLLPRGLQRLGMRRLAQMVQPLLALPDPQAAWLPFAIGPAIRQARSCDIIYSTSGPYISHLIALWARRRTGKPWIADFRDEWTLNPHLIRRYSPPPLLALNRLLERKVLQEADLVLATTPGHAAGFRLLLRDDQRSKVRVIPNGYDSADFDAMPARKSRRFRLVHTGAFYGVRRPTPLLEALELLLQSGAVEASDIRVIMAGWSAAPVDIPPGLADIIRLPGYLPHREAIRLLQSATAQVLIDLPVGGAGKDKLPAKLFEYLATGKPILAIVDEQSESARLVRRAGTGVVAPPHDVQAIAAAIKSLYDRWRADDLQVQPDWQFIQSFDRRRLTGELAALLLEVQHAALLHR